LNWKFITGILLAVAFMSVMVNIIFFDTLPGLREQALETLQFQETDPAPTEGGETLQQTREVYRFYNELSSKLQEMQSSNACWDYLPTPPQALTDTNYWITWSQNRKVALHKQGRQGEEKIREKTVDVLPCVAKNRGSRKPHYDLAQTIKNEENILKAELYQSEMKREYFSVNNADELKISLPGERSEIIPYPSFENSGPLAVYTDGSVCILPFEPDLNAFWVDACESRPHGFDTDCTPRITALLQSQSHPQCTQQS
jgi:hypothetical protein